MSLLGKLIAEISVDRIAYIEYCMFNKNYHKTRVVGKNTYHINQFEKEYYTLHLVGLFETSIIRDIFK